MSDGETGEGPGGRAARGRPRRRARPRRHGLRRLLPTWRMVFAGTTLCVLGGSGALVAAYLLVDIPEPRSAAAAEANVYRYADGSQLAVAGEVNRESVDLSRVPETVRHAVLAAEDRDFYEDPAVDVTAMVRAAWNMARGGEKQSGSTITQQYVKNYYLDQRQTVSRKVKELIIAVKLGREVDKDEILEGYLNTSYFGRNAYGVQAAARAYYDKDVAELDTAEGAYLAVLLNAPSAYDVRANPDNEPRAVARWEYVLDGMVSEGWLTRERRERLTFPEPREFRPADSLSGERGYLVEAVRQYLADAGVVSEEELARGGYRITTTIEPARQRALTRAVDERLLDRLSADEPPDSYARVGATSVDVASGRVVAMYGGRDYTEQFVNNATRRDYQAASTFKPFVYTAALRHRARTVDGRRIGPDTEYEGDSGREVVDREGEGSGWAPENENGEDFGELTVAEAMDRSVNAVFAQMGADVGPERVRETAVALGVPETTPGIDGAQGSISLGTATPSTLDVAEAYATLAAHGTHRDVSLVAEVTRNGERVELPEPRAERAVPREAADGTTAMLAGVVRDGTGRAAREAGRDAAGKTGTAEEDRAAWFAGYTPELATVVAVFGQDPESGEQRELYGVAGRERIGGGGFPAEIWAQYTRDALAGEPRRSFDLAGVDAEDAERDEESEGSDESPSAEESGGSGDPDGTEEPTGPAEPRQPGRTGPPGGDSPPETPPPAGTPGPGEGGGGTGGSEETPGQLPAALLPEGSYLVRVPVIGVVGVG
ncbi:transglycosylase domain-containing protein [Streptomyces millisiae]|uniref:Transglycosylase domain-containing protein n=1 Tax=Streptomyces millisiae TaxID=3075542 RepID=A0ABU2LWQ4_9ACTN|nr:transglycosylase domain-containing protein [Streptomyces sp. DSM 44918]MDT0322013.1 transglycosylase domain-containing protein [Streptomyces sp. DSM 44918]